MIKDKAALIAICQIMSELETLDALAEYWQEQIFKESDKDCYIKLRLDAKGQTKEEAEIVKEYDDDDGEEVFYQKWHIDEHLLHRGPDRCTLGHSLHRCENTPIQKVEDDDDN